MRQPLQCLLSACRLNPLLGQSARQRSPLYYLSLLLLLVECALQAMRPLGVHGVLPVAVPDPSSAHVTCHTA